jgi:hypothetical protein
MGESGVGMKVVGMESVEVEIMDAGVIAVRRCGE